MLRSPRQRVGILPNADLPPPDSSLSHGAGGSSVERLLRKALVERDAAAFRAAFQDLRPEMIAQAQVHVRSRDDAQEVVQDTWLAALRGIHRFQDRSSLRTWLFRILRNRAATAGSRSSRMVPASQLERNGQPGGIEGEGPIAGGVPVNAPPVWTPEEIAEGMDLNGVLQDALAQLPDRQREVLVLRDLDGRSAEETEAIMGLTSANQRVLLHRARTRLRALVSRRWS